MHFKMKTISHYSIFDYESLKPVFPEDGHPDNDDHGKHLNTSKV